MVTSNGAPERVHALQELPEGYQHLRALNSTAEDILGPRLIELVKVRASLVNGCGFCIDMHTRDAIKQGEDQRRLFALAAWHETASFFTEAEQAALALVDEVTRIGEHGVSDEVYAGVARHYSEREIAALVMATGVINVFNRVAITSRKQPPALD